ncbi:UDP-2,3-diacylglucosamine diphosphatase LpxI [Deferribacterales bacterium RsTz2092]|nr:hypothetical protein AGMMS49941_09260 [Deferribacterales bacterium]
MHVVVIAGKYQLPALAVERLKAAGVRVSAIVFEDEVAQAMRGRADDVEQFQITQVGAVLKHIKMLAQSGADSVLFAGKFSTIVLEWGLKFDLKALTMLAMLKDRRTDTIMLAIIEEIEKLGVKVLSQMDICKDLLITEGLISKTKPTDKQMNDVHFGYKIARGIAGLDIGQSVVVNNLDVIAVEAIEGTDRLIVRAGELLPKGGWTLVKVAKPIQDVRFDVPTIGMTTLQNIKQAGGKVIAIEADRTFIVEREECVKFLNANKIALLGYKADN